MNRTDNPGVLRKDQTLNRIYLFSLFAGIATLVVIADRAPLDLESVASGVNISQKFVYYWQGVVYRFFPGPYVYRILVPYLYWGVNKLTHLSLINIDFFTKIVLLVTCQYTLLRYLNYFFEKVASLLGVFIFDSLLGYLLSFIKGPSIIETMDILNFAILVLALIALYRQKFLFLSLFLFIGLLNRETPIVLLPIMFTCEWLQTRKVYRSFFVSVLAIGAFLGARMLVSSWAGTTWFNTNELQANLPFLFGGESHEAAIGNIRLIILAGPFVFISLYRFGQHPLFLKVASLALPMLILIHYMTGRIAEARLWIPLFPFLIPLILNNLVKLNSRPASPPQES